jgi:hypothetical protein
MHDVKNCMIYLLGNNLRYTHTHASTLIVLCSCSFYSIGFYNYFERLVELSVSYPASLLGFHSIIA